MFDESTASYSPIQESQSNRESQDIAGNGVIAIVKICPKARIRYGVRIRSQNIWDAKYILQRKSASLGFFTQKTSWL